MPRKTALAALLVVLPVGSSAYEVVAHYLRSSEIAKPEDWRAAAAAIRRERRSGDLVVAAPHWIRQTAYRHLGDDLVPLRDAARADTSTHRRLWVVSIRDAEAPESVGRRAEIDRRFGQVRLQRFLLPRPARVAYDFVDRISDARVTLEGGGPEKDCPWTPPSIRLRTGRFQCDPRRPWNRVGEVVMDDLAHQPHRAIWAHPVEGRRIVIETDDVPMAKVLRGHTGLGYEAARLTGPLSPVVLEIFVDDERVLRAVHRQRDGWKRFEVDTRALRGRRATVRFEVRARKSGMRHFYFDADTRDP